MFSQVFACPRGWGGVHPPPLGRRQTPPLGRHPQWTDSPGQTPSGQTPPWAVDPTPPPTADGHCSGRYAFLLTMHVLCYKAFHIADHLLGGGCIKHGWESFDHILSEGCISSLIRCGSLEHGLGGVCIRSWMGGQ